MPDTPDPKAKAAGKKAAAESDAAAPAQTAEPNVVDLDAARAEGRAQTLAYVTEVNEVCALAGQPGLASGFIAQETPVAQVRKQLLEARAAQDEQTAIAGAHGGGDTSKSVADANWERAFQACGAIPQQNGRL